MDSPFDSTCLSAPPSLLHRAGEWGNPSLPLRVIAMHSSSRNHLPRFVFLCLFTEILGQTFLAGHSDRELLYSSFYCNLVNLHASSFKPVSATVLADNAQINPLACAIIVPAIQSLRMGIVFQLSCISIFPARKCSNMFRALHHNHLS